MNSKLPNNNSQPLTGIRVLEMGQLIAGPFAGQMLASFGAEVVKVEPPGRGDPLRIWRELDESGTSYWWRSIARNKHSLTLDLAQEQGRQLARQLIMKTDVVLENFRPGRMESWGLGPETFTEDHPQLIYTRVSGYGQTGPYASKPGFASACEGRGGAGQSIDVSIVESVFNMLEGVLPEYDGAGVIREPSGSTVTGIVPTNTYRCNDGRFIVIGGNGDTIFQRLCWVIGAHQWIVQRRLLFWMRLMFPPGRLIR